LAGSTTITIAPLKILVVHNRYKYRGGEDAVVDAEVDLLRRYDHSVNVYARSNDELQTLSLPNDALRALWSMRTVHDLECLIQQQRPDIVHVHNTWPLVSPSLYWAVHRAKIPLVQTLHNFRLLCPQGLMLREGRVCESCVGHIPWRAVRFKCYRNDIAASVVVAAMVQSHRVLGTWRRRVTRYIALSEFSKTRFVQGGLPAERISVKPNFVDVPKPLLGPRNNFLFVGRLSTEKGLAVLARAASQLPSGVLIEVAGSGPEASRLQNHPNIALLGHLQPHEVYRKMGSARALVLPSIVYENHPRTLVEAYACSLPVIASRLGGMIDLVRHNETGLLFDAGNPEDLAMQLRWASENPERMLAMGDAAHAYYRNHLTGPVNHGLLLGIYQQAIAESGWPNSRVLQ